MKLRRINNLLSKCSIFIGNCLHGIIFRVARRMAIVFLFIVFLNSPSPSNARSSCNEKVISEAVLNFMKKYHVDGATVLLANQGKIKTCLFGEAVPAKHIPVSEDTIFELGSITKTFTGLILAQSILSDKTQLSEAIEYDSGDILSPALKKITYLELATYTSGLPFNAKDIPYNATDSTKKKLN